MVKNGFIELDNDKDINELYIKYNTPKPKKEPQNYRDKYESYINSKEWKVIRKNIFKRDDNKCVMCESIHNLNCHHLTYTNLCNENMEELVTLCIECHDEEHNKINNSGLSVAKYYDKHPLNKNFIENKVKEEYRINKIKIK